MLLPNFKASGFISSYYSKSSGIGSVALKKPISIYNLHFYVISFQQCFYVHKSGGQLFAAVRSVRLAW